MRPVNIRPLNRTDAAIFHALRLDALMESPEAFGATYEEEVLLSLDVVADRIDQIQVEPQRVVFGAVEGEAILGIVGCMQESRIKSRHKAVVWGCYVHPSARGRGLGGELLSHLIAHVAQWDHVDALTLTVVTRAEAARALYRSVGFTVFGKELDGLREHGVSDTVEYMSLHLPRRHTALTSE